MAGSKRRRGASKSPSAASTVAASATSSSSSSASAAVSKTLQHLVEIAEAQPKETLQAFCDGKCWIDNSTRKSSVPNWNTYWIVLGTHMMNRLIKREQNFVVLSAFCDALSKILVSDKNKLEKASHSASSRSILARAMLTTTVASLLCVQNLAEEHPAAFQAAVSSLDRLIHLKADEDKGGDDDGEGRKKIDWIHELGDLQELCSGIPSITAEETSAACLEEAEGTKATTPPAKRPRTRRKGAAAASAADKSSGSSTAATSGATKATYDTTVLHQAMETIMEDSSQRIDGRAAVKRWASMALVWLCQGQLQILQFVHKLAASSIASANKKGQLPIELVSHNINRLVMLASEAGNHCGLRPPTGGMDQYMRFIAVPQPKKSKFVRVDIRDWATVCISDLIQVHRKCLENLPAKRIVNERDDADTQDVAATLSSLCRAAASGVPNSTFSEQGEWTKTLLSIASAKCLQLSTNPTLAMDCKLTNFGLTHLEDCLRSLEQQGSSSSAAVFGTDDDDEDEEEQRLERMFSLGEPLPDPEVQSAGGSADESAFSHRRQCTFAGLLPPSSRSEFSHEQAVALALRALHPCEDSPAAALVSTLNDIVRRVYDTREHSEEGEGKKKAKGTTRRAKRRKVEEVNTTDDVNWKRVTPARALVANEALSALRHCLTISSSSVLRRSIRKSLSVRQLENLVRLSESLDKTVLKTRTEPVKIDVTDSDSPPPNADVVFFTGSTASNNQKNNTHDYTHCEKLMWAAHMSMCQTLGRGKTSFDGNLLHTPLIPSSFRKQLYKSIASSHKTSYGLEWPLTLPAGYHAFLVANLTSEPISSENMEPELYIAKECIKSIHHVLLNPNVLIRKQFKSDELYLDDEIPFSHRDARTFLLAVCRLTTVQQRKCLEDLARATLEAVMTMQHGEERQNLLSNGEASGFLARVLVVCTALVDIISYGSSLREHFFTSAGPVTLPLPVFTSNSEWYRCDRCFMGLFSDWESPALPELNHPQSSVPNVKETTINELQVVFESAFSLGFETAINDHCHLLFAAWNGLGKIHFKTRRTPSLSNSNFPSFQVSSENISKQILNMRDDVCSIQKDINEGVDRAILSSSRLKANLSLMLKQAKAALDTILNDHVSDDSEMSQEVPIALFSLLSALPCYVSSSIAGHTKPGNDYFSTTLSKNASRRPKRQRGYSSGSDPTHSQSDADSVETDGGGYDSDVRVDVLSRLRECCDAFGAAPIHPDWLDVSCSLRDGFSPNDAIESAECALATLNKLVTVAFQQFKKHYFEAIKVYHKHDESLGCRINLCLTLCQFSTHESAATSVLGPGPYPDDREWKDDIASVCDLHQDVLDLVLDEAVVCNVDQARESWCPNAAQRLVGKLQDRNRLIGGWETSIAELRAGGEWELLLSEALSIPCLDVKEISTEASEAKVEWDEDAIGKGCESLKTAFLWRSVLISATSHLMPAAALLRLGLNNKVGRKPHPFSFHENNQDPYDVAPLSFSERLSGNVTVPPTLKAVSFETLALLSRLSAEGDDNLTTVCHAISAQLVIDTASFSDLEGLQSIRFAFMGLKRIRQILSKSKKKGTPEVVPHVVERLIAVIEDFGRSPRNKISSTVESSEEFQRLLAYFGAQGTRRADCAVENSVELFDILTAKTVKELDEDEIETFVWTEKPRQAQAITELVDALSANVLNANERSRACLALLLSHLADLESHPAFDTPKTGSSPIIVPAVINSFNLIDEKRLKNLISRDLCGSVQSSKQELVETTPKPNLRPDLSRLLGFLLSTRGHDSTFARSRLVLDILLDSFDTWSQLDYQHREPVLDVLFLYGCRFDQLRDIGTRLLKRATSTNEDDQTIGNDAIKTVSKFFGFVRALSNALDAPTGQKEKKALGANESSSKIDVGTPGASAQDASIQHPKSCSFAQKSGFRAQHWYNCYSCQLVWDKGCCTLCAMVCHRGHDVSYSRYSSFFCDCGAEDGNVTEQTRVSCKCLAPLPVEQVEKIFKHEESDFLTEGTDPNKNGSNDTSSRETETELNNVGVEIARDCFRLEALASIKGFRVNVKDSPWFEALVRMLRQQFQVWKNTRSPKSGLEFLLNETTKGENVRPVVRVPHNILRKNLRNRRAKVLDLQRMAEKSLIPVRAAKGFQVRMSSDTASNAHLAGQLSRHDTTRSIVATDSRGRMVIAEPCSLVFCSAIPAVSVRHVNRPYETPLSRYQMCMLGTASIRFHVVGLKTCSENESLLVIWGRSEACVAFLKPNWDGVEETVDLVFDLDHHDGEGDHLVKCEWIPGSQTHLAVGCSRFVRIYDISKSDSDKRALPVIGYNLGFEASLRDVTMVPYEEGGDGDGVRRKGAVSKMFLLLENGRLHVVDLKTASGGRLESPGDQHFEPSECIGLSTAGVRPRSGSSIGQPGASTRTLGEGSKLAYLKQSRVLLYKCVSSCVLALMLDPKGDVEGTFELIPHTISSDVLGNGPDGYSVTGPFTHWTELGVVYREGASYFRVACVGKSSKSNKPKLLCIEFNENDVRVKEVIWLSSSSMGLGLSLSMSFEGLSVFSAPFVEGNSDKRVFGERAYLCAATSNGSLLFFGDESVDTITQQKDGLVSNKTLQPVTLVNLSGIAAMQAKKPVFPLTRFESLKNISESDAVVFGGEGTASEPSDLKSRLSRDSSSSFLCPRREGCTLTISLKPKPTAPGDQKTQIGDGSLQQIQAPPSDPVIAALRILVGSTSNYIPSKIYVQGRPVDLTPRVKKWYCLPLTDEEIALSVRNGFVTVGIGPSFDSSTSIVVDSIEVYAAERNTIGTWLPKEYYQRVTSGQPELYTASQLPSGLAAEKTSDDSHGLILSARALTNLCELVGSSKLIAEGERDFLRQLIQDTALDRDKNVSECVHSLLESLEPDSRSRKSFYDESILFGCSLALQNSKEILGHTVSSKDGDETVGDAQKWAAIRVVVQDCLEAASAIARERPMNYLQSMQNIVENNMSSGSIAVDASKLIIEGLLQETHYEELISGLGGIIDLSLTEMAIELNTDAPHSKQFAKFDVIRRLLECDTPLVVEQCCEAIASFCRNHGGTERPPNDAPDLFTLLQHARFVAYQCDSCELCPMKEIRYTLLEDDYDIDLCKDCYRLGKEFAESQGFDPKVNVVIDGKTVGGETKLTCVQMKQMQPVSLEKMDVEQVEVKSSRQGGSPEVSPEEDEDLQKALLLSLGETASDENDTSDLPMGHQAYEYFVGHLFTSVVDLLSSVLKRERSVAHVGPLIRLLLDLVRNSKQPDSQNERARRFSKELSHGVSHILKAGSAGNKLAAEKFNVLVTCLRSFTNLLVPETDSNYILEGSHIDENVEEGRSARAKEKVSQKFICDVHNIPAVRRRCARGIHKDRRFYVCGKERGQRCKYFVWADEVESKPEKKAKPKSSFNEFIRGFLWTHTASTMPIHARLCRLLEDEVLGDDPEDFEVSLSLSNSSPEDQQTNNAKRKNFYGAAQMERDLIDGVYCSREKMQDVVSGVELVKGELDCARELRVPAQNPGDRGVTLLEASLDLLTLVADHKTEGVSRWFSLLCEINISTNKPPSLRALAKRVLKTLCGGNKTLYHSVRDHFAFGFQLRNLYRNAATALEAALVVKEKARQCSENWSNSEEVTWANLKVGDLIGTEDLISEDSYTQLCSKKLGKVLDELWSVIKNRGESWRRFCGLQVLPHSHRENIGSRSDVAEGEHHLSATAPITALFWMASALNGSNQVKLLRLVDFALTNWKERKAAHGKSQDSSSDEEGGNEESCADDTLAVASEQPSLLPEDIMLGGDRKLTVDGIVAFAMTTLYAGRTVELRKVAYHVLVKLCDRLTGPERALVFQRLIGSPLSKIGVTGKTCVEFLHLLQSLCRSPDPSVSVKEAAEFVMRCFVEQMSAVKYDRSNGEWFVLEAGSGVSTTKKKFDLADCGYCVRPHHFGTKEGSAKANERREGGTRAGSRNRGSGNVGSTVRSSSAASRSQQIKKWHPEQVCAFGRSQLDSLKDSSASNEFCTFFTLKHRVVISDIDLTVNDPRGRYVKTVTVYCAPRPVDDVAELKSERFGVKWQRCATLTLARGATRASSSLSHLMVAANLKVEFTDFYERPGGSKASDGSLLVHCPRCTRVVTNAHGVCGNCGEVAFQCRKCRHINYDRLDAFLCVECGYCASGSFSFELNCGIASNAVALTNDKDRESAAKILTSVSTIHGELRDAIREKLRRTTWKKKPVGKKDDSSPPDFSPALQRAFLGLPPLPATGDAQEDVENSLSRVEQQGSVVKLVARPDSIQSGNRASSAVDRTRSLLRLARQIRSESNAASDRRRGPSDVIIRHLGRGLAIDNLDDENDLIGLLEGGSVLDSSEPLSRVIASVQSRRRAESGRSSAQGRRGGETSASRKNESGKELFEECQRLHMLMREAERECNELDRRIEAWNRLDAGYIVDAGSNAPVSSMSYTPSHCSSCAATVALQLLLLWSRLFLSDPDSVNVDHGFLLVLLEEIPTVSRALMDCKRQVVQEIATKSRDGAKLVLAELRKRLSATNDTASSNILGKILEVEGFEMSEDYAKLAMEVLAARR